MHALRALALLAPLVWGCAGPSQTTRYRALEDAWLRAAPADARPGGCAVDKSLAHLVSRDASGTTVERTTSGVTAEGRGVHIGAADAEGDLFFVVGSGSTPGLWRLPAAGGAAEQVAPGYFPTLLVI